jgi:hypothetical protein
VADGGTGGTTGSITGTGALVFTAGGSDQNVTLTPSGTGVIVASSKIKTSGLFPASDSTTAFRLYKADGSTAVATLDTTNSLFGVNCTPAKRLESLDASAAQLRLTHTAATDYCDFQVDTDGYLAISPSGASVGINGTPQAYLDVIGNNDVQLRLTHTASTDYCDFTVDTNGTLSVDPSINNVSGTHVYVKLSCGNTYNGYLTLHNNNYDAGSTVLQARKGLGFDDDSNFCYIASSRCGGDWGTKLYFGKLSTYGDFGTQSDRFVFDVENKRFGVNQTSPARGLESLDASNPQLRLTHTSGSVYTDFKVASDGQTFCYPTSVSSGGYWFNLMGDSNYVWIGVGEGAGEAGYFACSRISDDERQPILIRGSDIELNCTPGTGAVLPNADNSITLGSDTYEWKEVWATDTSINSSDIRKKTNILPTLGLAFIDKLNPVSYRWKDTDTTIHKRQHHGLIAQEVKSVLDDIGVSTNDFGGYVYSEKADKYFIRYTEFIAPLIKAVQELSTEVTTLRAEVAALRGV